ncbi:peptide ABC transporter substrate-binding protein [Psychromonas sp. psych-6C06]|uniref:ABC transporter substrate-binding protein n=1 Tax=Psychromonas sp. psych-6C06 TaxID=2058089 RepID=UPI000C339781|nr:ABC transporter substrate-binding protein [Psychromonas sp. psych-6C06]PKF62837.1 peptide ABC transporter substrate-binding protein [Psychromonas sp. psych-6C06]
MKKTVLVSCLLAGLATSSAVVAQSEKAQIKQGGDLTLITKLVDAHVRNFNPYNDAVGQYYARDFMYETLWIPNIMHPDKPIPVLATSYDVAKDLKSVTFNLREGVKWSDGEEFTADDVVFTVELAKKFPAYNVQGVLWYDETSGEGNIASVEKLGKYQVRINLQKPNGLAYLGLGAMYPLPEHIWKDVKDPKNFRNENPVATGPFINVKRFTPSIIKVCRNENYWQQGKPYLDCLKFPQYSGNEQALAAAAKGRVDWLGVGLSDTKSYSKKSKDNKFWLSPGGNTNLQLNTTKAPFNNLEFRKAMSMAINRTDLVEFATFGLTTATKYPIGTGEFYKSWYNEENLAKYKYLMEYNPKAAMKILDDAGIKDIDGDGWRDNADGTPINFKISVPSGWTDWVNSVMQISENLQDIGINARAHTPDENAWFDAVPTGDFDAYIMWTHSNVVPWGTYNDMFNPKDMNPPKLSFQAMHQMRLPELMVELDKFTQTIDLDEQKALIGKVHEIVAENLPVISLFANPEWYEYSTRNITGWVTEENPYVRPMVHGGTPERWFHVLQLHQK